MLINILIYFYTHMFLKIIIIKDVMLSKISFVMVISYMFFFFCFFLKKINHYLYEMLSNFINN